MQSVSSRIWTRVAVSISYDDNHYTTGTSSTITTNLYCNQLCCLKTALDKKNPSLVNRKRIILHHNNPHLHTGQLTQDLLEDLGKNYFILHILLTLLLLIITCFGNYRILWIVLGWHQENRLNTNWSHILLQNLNNFTSMASISLLTDGMSF